MPIAAASPSCEKQAAPVGGGLMATIVRHYDDLVSHVRRHIGRSGGDHSEARDVVHDVCVELIAAPPPYEIHTPLAFLRDVARRRAIDRYRSDQSRRSWLVDSAELPDVPDPSAFGRDPAVLFADRQRAQTLACAIRSLPPRCRDVFVMHKIHELRQTEVADRLGISIKTVEKHLRLGMAACRSALEDALPAERQAASDTAFEHVPTRN